MLRILIIASLVFLNSCTVNYYHCEGHLVNHQEDEKLIHEYYYHGEHFVSGGALNVAISGAGFFQIMQQDGTYAYTRHGKFHLDENGLAVTERGDVVSMMPTIDLKATAIDISSCGTISQTVNNITTNIGSLELYRFRNSEYLRFVGEGLYVETPKSGKAEAGTPGEDGFGEVRQGFLEALERVKVVTLTEKRND